MNRVPDAWGEVTLASLELVPPTKQHDTRANRHTFPYLSLDFRSLRWFLYPFWTSARTFSAVLRLRACCKLLAQTDSKQQAARSGGNPAKQPGLFQTTNQNKFEGFLSRKGGRDEVEGLVLHGASFSPPSGYAAELRHSQSTILLLAEGSAQSSPRGATANQRRRRRGEGAKKTEQRLKFLRIRPAPT